MIRDCASASPHDSISVFVYYANKYIVKLNMASSDRIGNLRDRVDVVDCDLLFNGEILMDSVTFQMYGIHDRDAIVAVRRVAQSLDVSHWLSITRDSEAFQDRIRFFFNEQTSRELGRISDVAMLRIERRPRMFRRMCYAVESVEEQRPEDLQKKLNAYYTGATAPTSAEMPFAWSSSHGADEPRCISTGPTPVNVKPEQQASILRPVCPSDS
jgi:hypothetical protein